MISFPPGSVVAATGPIRTPPGKLVLSPTRRSVPVPILCGCPHAPERTCNCGVHSCGVSRGESLRSCGVGCSDSADCGNGNRSSGDGWSTSSSSACIRRVREVRRVRRRLLPPLSASVPGTVVRGVTAEIEVRNVNRALCCQRISRVDLYSAIASESATGVHHKSTRGFRTPPLNTTSLSAAPSWLSPLTTSTPALIEITPAKTLAALVSVSRSVPSLINPLPPAIGALIVTGALAPARSRGTRGLSWCSFEQFDVGHARGSSHGTSRIFRLNYADERFVRMAMASDVAWREARGRARGAPRRAGGLPRPGEEVATG